MKNLTSSLQIILCLTILVSSILKQQQCSSFVVLQNKINSNNISVPQKSSKMNYSTYRNYSNYRQQQRKGLFAVSVKDDIEDNTNKSEKSTENNEEKNNAKISKSIPNIVLVAGFESFNRGLYYKAADQLPQGTEINLIVFSDAEIRNKMTGETNTKFKTAMMEADAFIGSLIFDYDDALAVKELLPLVDGPRFVFESATELMPFNRVGKFRMDDGMKDGSTASGPPPVVKAILSKFSSGKEEDKLQGYSKLLKVGPDLLKFIPGDNKLSDLRTWLEAYRYWSQGGGNNVSSMLQLISQRLLSSKRLIPPPRNLSLPELEVTPDIGLLHPLKTTSPRYFTSPADYLSWRLSPVCQNDAKSQKFKLAPITAPKVAILLYRKHVITGLRYINDLITLLEENGLTPIPIFINGIEAHVIVRDLLTSSHEIHKVNQGLITRDTTYDTKNAVEVDAIVNTIGFPLVGGPAGSMEAGRNVAVAEKLLSDMNVPYFVSAPLLLQSITQWKQNGVLGLQSVVLYALPELDGAIDTIVLGGLVGDKIALVPERVRKLTSRVKGWVELRRTPKKDRKVSILLYGFPPNVGAVGTAALLDVPQSLEALLKKLHSQGYDVDNFAADPNATGESLVAALAVMCEGAVIASGGDKMQEILNQRIDRAKSGDKTTAATLALPSGGLGGAKVKAYDVTRDELDDALGKYMAKKVEKSWSTKDRGPGVSSRGNLVVSGLQLGNVWIGVQPLLGVEGDPMRLLFERDLTPHPQYCAFYEWMKRSEDIGGIGSQAVIHLGMHGTVEWLPGQPLGNDRKSWSDSLLGSLPNLYVYAANNPSESILAKRRGYATLISYNVPPYGRAGLYLELANLKELVFEYRMEGGNKADLREAIWSSCQKSELISDIPLYTINDEGIKQEVSASDALPDNISNEAFDEWMKEVSEYLNELQDRLFSQGLHVLGAPPTDEHLSSYLMAYFGDRLSSEECAHVIETYRKETSDLEMNNNTWVPHFEAWVKKFVSLLFPTEDNVVANEAANPHELLLKEASDIVKLLSRTTEELDSLVNGLDGGYVPPAPGGDLLRDGTSVLPTGRNIHALDPYRMPSAGAWARGQRAAEETLRQHQEANDSAYPKTVAVTLWGLDAIKTRGESVAIVLALVGAYPVKEGTGRVVRFDLKPLEELGRPRIDILASLSGIFRDSFANVVDLLDDLFERAAAAEDESPEMNYIKKHAMELAADGVERPAARLFSNPPGDFGSMVNEVVGSGEWDDSESLGETWMGRNVYSYGKNEGGGSTARPEVLDKLLTTTERVVQEIDSVEYGLTDIQEYYANTGALKKAAENRKTGTAKKKVDISIIEAFGGGGKGDAAQPSVPVRNLEDVLRLEYRSKLLNPKWRDAMLKQGSGGAFEVSQRMTAMVGWAATAQVDNFVFNQAAERYALDEEVAEKLRTSNPEAFKNVIRRLLEAAGRGMWDTNEDTLEKLRGLYSEADDMVEQVSR